MIYIQQTVMTRSQTLKCVCVCVLYLVLVVTHNKPLNLKALICAYKGKEAHSLIMAGSQVGLRGESSHRAEDLMDGGSS